MLEFSAPDAIARFVMIFEDAGDLTRITQRISLTGEAASTYAGPIREGLPAGMRKLCESMEEAARASTG
ncbi:MAG: hypothetical protein H7Y20_15945 [Bryobacteraceae bacterium]|nr:hypothetical protein [Bryobacteraceae bacterium]